MSLFSSYIYAFPSVLVCYPDFVFCPWIYEFEQRCTTVAFIYIDDVLSLNNSKFGDYVERIYPIELEMKDTTDTVKSASYLDLHLEIDNEGRLKTKLYDKC